MGKPFFIILVLFLFIVIFASNAVNNVNLTNTPLPPGGNTSGAAGANRTVLLGGRPQPGLADQGGCASPYTIRAGDTLSRIAQTCGVTLQALLAANPTISNPNLIQPGQKLVMAQPQPAAQPAVAAPAATAPAAKPVATATPNPTETIRLQNMLPVAQTSAANDLQDSLNSLSAAQASQPTRPVHTLTPAAEPAPLGMRPGGSFDVQVRGFPPGAKVQVSLSSPGFAPTVIGEGAAGSDGVYNGVITLPRAVLPGAQYRVTLQTLTQPVIKVSSAPFVIQ